MALKITKEIGTNRGITNNAYIRIHGYEISKQGFLKLNLQMYQNEEDAIVKVGETPLFKESFSLEIGSTFIIPLVKTLTRQVEKDVFVEEEYEKSIPLMDENNKFTGEFKTELAIQKVPKKMMVEEEYGVPDLSLLVGADIFEFGYSALKVKLIQLFGAENVVDC